jgi:hypothetical protein
MSIELGRSRHPIQFSHVHLPDVGPTFDQHLLASMTCPLHCNNTVPVFRDADEQGQTVDLFVGNGNARKYTQEPTMVAWSVLSHVRE